ncbi:alpha/beta fold hydrolase [Tabrizicola sp.]|uniref:alpha/beta fold hydrolase n=1 Tax=Tabrizicola sp. TaxID=2005166 RepID=UPI003D2B4056
MAEVLLVPGSGFGAWAYDRLTPALAALGHRARALDLPGRDGSDTRLQDHAEAILAAIDDRAILVGHSAAGFPITLAAALAPSRVQGLIYLAAYIPQPGKSLADLRRAAPLQPMRGAFQISADRTSYRFDPARCRDLFFHDTDDFTPQMGPEPIRPQETPFPGPLPNTPRAALIARDDRALPPDWQRQMAAGMAQEELASGHCPHLSMPKALAQTLDAMIKRIENPT